MPIVFTAVMQDEIAVDAQNLNQNAEILKRSNDEIVLKFEDVVKQDMQFQKDYMGASKVAYQNAINTLYGRCHSISEVQLRYAEELEMLAIESLDINEDASEKASGGGMEE